MISRFFIYYFTFTEYCIIFRLHSHLFSGVYCQQQLYFFRILLNAMRIKLFQQNNLQITETLLKYELESEFGLLKKA